MPKASRLDLAKMHELYIIVGKLMQIEPFGRLNAERYAIALLVTATMLYEGKNAKPISKTHLALWKRAKRVIESMKMVPKRREKALRQINKLLKKA